MHNKLKLSTMLGFPVGAAAALLVACSDTTDPGGAGSAGSPGTAGVSTTGGNGAGGAPSATAGAPLAMAGSPPATGGISGVSGSMTTGGTGASGAPTQAGSGGVAAGGSTTGGTASGGGGASGGAAAGGSSGSGSCGTATAKPCPPTAPNSIAYIGCSMANNIGNGYKVVNGKAMWNSDGYGTGAQCVPQWVEGGSAWGGFDNKMNAIGGKDVVKAIMVQICIISPATDAQVKSMIKAARAHTNPETHIYLVGQPQYENGHHCAIAGNQEATTEEQAKRIGDDKSVDSNMSYLGTFLLNCDNGECADSCHANPKGEERLGKQAKAFWGEP